MRAVVPSIGASEKRIDVMPRIFDLGAFIFGPLCPCSHVTPLLIVKAIYGGVFVFGP